MSDEECRQLSRGHSGFGKTKCRRTTGIELQSDFLVSDEHSGAGATGLHMRYSAAGDDDSCCHVFSVENAI
jgi:hypothetical protein